MFNIQSQKIFLGFKHEISCKLMQHKTIWQARPPQWEPQQRCANNDSATLFRSTKSRQDYGLCGLASCGGPAVAMAYMIK